MTCDITSTAEYMCSALGKAPTVCFVKELNDYIVLWKTFVIPFSIALYVFMQHKGLYPGPGPTLAMKHRHRAIMRSRIVPMSNTMKFADTPGTWIANMRTEVTEFTNSHTAEEIFAMLNPDNAITISLLELDQNR